LTHLPVLENTLETAKITDIQDTRAANMQNLPIDGPGEPARGCRKRRRLAAGTASRERAVGDRVNDLGQVVLAVSG